MSLIVVAVMAAICLCEAKPSVMFAGERSSNPKELEQRLAALEQVVVAQQAQMAALNNQVASQQWEINRFAPLADEMRVTTWSDGSKSIDIQNADLWVKGPMSQVVDLVIIGNLYHYGSIVQLP